MYLKSELESSHVKHKILKSEEHLALRDLNRKFNRNIKSQFKGSSISTLFEIDTNDDTLLVIGKKKLMQEA